MKALKTKVILSGIVLVFAFIATIGTTFAWFTVSQSTTVDTMELNVTAADNLLITPYYETANYVADNSGDGYTILENGSFDLLTASNYQTSITNEDMIAAGYLYDNTTELTGPWSLKPATVINTTYDGFNGKAMNSIDVTDRELTLLDSPGSFNSSAGFFIELRFWVLSQSGSEQPIEIDNLSITSSSPGVKADVANAARMSIWFDDSFGPSTGSTVGDAFIFGNDNDYDYEFTDAVFTSEGLGDTLNEVADAANSTTGSTLQADAAGEILLISEPTDLTTDLYTIQNNIPTLVTARIYVEGWDRQADNDITESLFSISFGFKFGEQDA